jgi:hypothetical protein
MSTNLDDDMDFEEEPLPSSPAKASAKAKSASAKAASAKAKSASAEKKATSPKAAKKGTSFKGSPGSGSGNFIVNPETGNVIQVRRLDRKSNTMKYNSIYTELVNTLGQDKVNAIKRYQNKGDADAVAAALRDERKANGVGRNGEAKTTMYYFNKVTHHVGTKIKAGESHPEAFASKLEAQMWGFEKEYLKKKPVENPKGELGTRPGDEMIRYTMTVKVVNGRETNTFKEWINNKGKATSHQETYRQSQADAGVTFKAPKLYTVAERKKMSDQKSSAAKAARSSTKDAGDVDAAAKAARGRGIAEATIKKILDNAKLTHGLKVSALNLQGKGGSGGPGVYMTKRKVVNGRSEKELGARANMVWTAAGVLKPKAREFVSWYQSVSGKGGKSAKEMSDKEVSAILDKAAGEGWFVKTEKV